MPAPHEQQQGEPPPSPRTPGKRCRVAPVAPDGGGPTSPDDPRYRSCDVHDRLGAETAARATVHGVTMLILDGPTGRLSREDRALVIERSIDSLLTGLVAPRDNPDGS